MLRVIPILVGLVLVNSLYAQDWFPDSASWIYRDIIPGMGDSQRNFVVKGDTIIQGKNCKIISGACSCGPEINYLFEEDDKIFVFDFQSDSFNLLYNFNLEIGDTLISEGGQFFEDGLFLIDSITHMQVGPLNLRVQHISQLGIYMNLGNKIIERIGSDLCLYPQPLGCIPPTGPLWCYEDPDIGLIKFPGSPGNCDFASSINKVDEDYKLNVYPNPASETIYIESNQLINKIEMFNGLSIQYFRYTGVEDKYVTLDTKSFPSGMYYLRFTFSGGSILLKTIAIQK